MKESTKTQLLNIGIGALTLLGMYLNTRLHEREKLEMKEEIKQSLIEESRGNK